MFKFKWMRNGFFRWFAERNTGREAGFENGLRFFAATVGAYALGSFLGMFIGGGVIDHFGELSTLGCLTAFVFTPLTCVALTQAGRLHVAHGVDGTRHTDYSRRIYGTTTSVKIVERYVLLSKDDKKFFPNDIIKVLKSNLSDEDRCVLNHRLAGIFNDIKYMQIEKQKTLYTAKRESLNIDGILETIESKKRDIAIERSVYEEHNDYMSSLDAAG